MIKKENYKLIDDTDYVSGKSNNGGCYSFAQKLVWDEEEMAYVLIHTTSADFSFCRCCGEFFQNKCSCGEEYIKLSMMAGLKLAKLWYEIAQNDDNLTYLCE